MKGFTPEARQVMDHLLDQFDVRECDILSAILQYGDYSMFIRSVEKSITKPTMRTRSSTYTRRTDPASIKSRGSQYGFSDMKLGGRYEVEAANIDRVISAARLHAMRRGLDYWYQRVDGKKSVLVCFMEKQR